MTQTIQHMGRYGDNLVEVADLFQVFPISRPRLFGNDDVVEFSVSAPMTGKAYKQLARHL